MINRYLFLVFLAIVPSFLSAGPCFRRASRVYVQTCPEHACCCKGKKLTHRNARMLHVRSFAWGRTHVIKIRDPQTGETVVLKSRGPINVRYNAARR